MRKVVQELLEKYQLYGTPDIFLGHDNKYHYVYLTINKIDEKFYIGKKSTSNLNEKYYGSGKYITEALEKYTDEAFIVYKLKFFNSAQEALRFEKVLVPNRVRNDSYCYNVKLGGGSGGWELYNSDEFEPGNKGLKADLLNQQKF
jgi:hypothetical protein